MSGTNPRSTVSLGGRPLHAMLVPIPLIGNVTALILSIFNCLIHTRDAYTSVVPSGLILSTLVVVILLVTSWNGRALVHRHGVGVRQTEIDSESTGNSYALSSEGSAGFSSGSTRTSRTEVRGECSAERMAAVTSVG
jgi:hypothetical protein